MKRILLFALLLICFSSTGFSLGLLETTPHDKEVNNLTGSLTGLMKAGKANLTFEFESIMGMTESDYAEFETDWNKDKPEIIGYFLEYANIQARKSMNFVLSQNAPYTIKVFVNDINGNGVMDCKYKVINSNGEEEASFSLPPSPYKETIGTKLSRIKYGAKMAGYFLGKYIRKQFKEMKN